MNSLIKIWGITFFYTLKKGLMHDVINTLTAKQCMSLCLQSQPRLCQSSSLG